MDARLCLDVAGRQTPIADLATLLPSQLAVTVCCRYNRDVAHRNGTSRLGSCDLAMEDSETVILELKTPYGPEYDFNRLKRGEAYNMANKLTNLLVEMFRKHVLTVTTKLSQPEVRVYYEISRQDSTFKTPLCWKLRVQNTGICMSRVGVHGESFVVRGAKMDFGSGAFQPYIFLAGLPKSVTMETLRNKGLVETILNLLSRRVLNPKAFSEHEQDLKRLQRDLDELACSNVSDETTTCQRDKP